MSQTTHLLSPSTVSETPNATRYPMTMPMLMEMSGRTRTKPEATPKQEEEGGDVHQPRASFPDTGRARERGNNLYEVDNTQQQKNLAQKGVDRDEGRNKIGNKNGAPSRGTKRAYDTRVGDLSANIDDTTMEGEIPVASHIWLTIYRHDGRKELPLGVWFGYSKS